jgi:mannose-6-phosphate isomerase-like protein (cupin superfamily)
MSGQDAHPSQPIAPGDVFGSPDHDLRATVLHADRYLFRADVHVGPRGNGGPLHRHLRQEERFLVHEGAVRVREGVRGSRVVGAGEEVAVAPGRPHTFRAIGQGAYFTAEFRPAWHIAEVFRDIFAASSEGRLQRHGYPRLMEVTALIDAYPDDFFYAPFIPVTAQRALARLLRRRTRQPT